MDTNDEREALRLPWHHQPYGEQNQNGDYSGGSIFDADGEYVVSEVSDIAGAAIVAAVNAFRPSTPLPKTFSEEDVERAARAITAYERELDRKRGDESERIWGHRGAHVPEFHPTQAGLAHADLSAVHPEVTR